MSESLQQLKGRMAQIARLNEVNSLLDWDQQTYMPPRAAASRGEQTATVSRIFPPVSMMETAATTRSSRWAPAAA